VKLELDRGRVCDDDKLIAVEKETRTPVTTISLGQFKAKVLDVSFIQSYAVFCPQCYNGIKDAGEEATDCGGQCRACKPESRIPWQLIAWAMWIMAALLLVPILKLSKEDDEIIEEIRKLIADGKMALKEKDRKTAAEDYRKIMYSYIQIQNRAKREMIKAEIMHYFSRIKAFYDFYINPDKIR
jgi:hypothetical protein